MTERIYGLRELTRILTLTPRRAAQLKRLDLLHGKSGYTFRELPYLPVLSGEDRPFFSPFAIDRKDPTRVYAGARRVYRGISCMDNMCISTPHRMVTWRDLFARNTPEIRERAERLLEFVGLHAKRYLPAKRHCWNSWRT